MTLTDPVRKHLNPRHRTLAPCRSIPIRATLAPRGSQRGGSPFCDRWTKHHRSPSSAPAGQSPEFFSATRCGSTLHVNPLRSCALAGRADSSLVLPRDSAQARSRVANATTPCGRSPRRVEVQVQSLEPWRYASKESLQIGNQQRGQARRQAVFRDTHTQEASKQLAV